MQTADVIRRIKRIFGDDNGAFIEDTDIIDWINDGQLEIAKKTECLAAKTTFTLVRSSNPDGSFALPSDFVIGTNVRWKGRPLSLTTFKRIDDASINLTDPDSEPIYYYYRGQEVFVWPVPTDADSNQVELTYVQAPTQIASSSDPLSIPLLYHEDLVRYGLMRARERNEDYAGAKQISDGLFARMAESSDLGLNQDDSFPVVRNDPADLWWV